MEKPMKNRRLSAVVGLGVGVVGSVMSQPAFAQGQAIVVESVTVQGDSVSIHLGSSAEGSAVSSFLLDGPSRIAIDIMDAEIAEGWKEQSIVSGKNVSDVQVTQFDDENGKIARVEILVTTDLEHSLRTVGDSISVDLSSNSLGEDLLVDALSGDPGDSGANSEPSSGSTDPLADALSEEATVAVSSNDTVIEVDPLMDALANDDFASDLEDAIQAEGAFVPASKLSGPEQLPGGTALTSLDFEQLDTESRIIIGIKDIQDYEVNRPRPDSLMIDIDGASLPKSLSRILDTKHFYSPVQMVRAYRTSNGARISISLSSDAEYSVSKAQNGYLIVSVPIPASMRQEQMNSYQAEASVAPGTPDTGLSNAYQKEILIGESGNTSDPQASFGTGGGANDPASMLGMSAGFMYDTGSSSNQKYTGKRISLDFVNADIHSIFRLISHVSNLNIVTGDDVSGRVTVRLQNVPWDQALAAVLQAKGLGSQKFGNIIRVAPIETIKSEQQSAVEAKRAQEELTELQLLVLPLNYAQASDLQSQVTELLSARGTLQVDTRGNQLIIKETEKRLAQIRELIRHLDKETPQVLIEARVVEASSNFTQMMGIQWGAELQANATTGYSTGLLFPNSVGMSGGLSRAGQEQFYSAGADNLLVDMGAEASNSGIAFSLGSIPGLIDLDARLSAMESDGYGKVVSEPRITTLDNQEARISQGARIPYLSASAGGTQVQFIEAALEMFVTPHITSDNQVFLDLNISNNRPDFSNLVQGQPAIQIKEAQTSVLVSNGDTTVIGGVFSTSTSYSQDRVPGFHKIPVLGKLFQNSADSVTRDEMMVFITPHIVTRTVSVQD
jgi:type IV pilus assembly protein PilQ